jgi:HK97 family phage major capsid protein
MDELEKLAARQRELLDLMEAVNTDLADETRSAEVRSADQRAWDDYEREFKDNEAKETQIRASMQSREQREARVREARAKWAGTQVAPGKAAGSDLYNVDYRHMGDEGTHRRWIDNANRVLDEQGVADHLRSDQRARLEKTLRTKNGDTDGELLAAFTIATSNPHYRSAFQKASSGLSPVFTAEEARAVRDVAYLKRAMSIGTQSAGGYAVPVVIDPTIILTAQGSANDILRLARVETITNDRWKGLSSAGVTWKFDAEAAAATDNSPTIAQPEIQTKRADGFIPFSIEIGQDWPGFAERMADLLGSGYEELLAEKLTTGTGANVPTGILSRLAAQTSPDVSTALTSAGVLSGADLYDIWARLPQRHRRKPSTAWMSSTDMQNAVRQLGTVDPNFTVNITEAEIPRLFGKEYPMNDYFPDLTSGTAAANLMVVGNWQGYLVAQRAGMNIEFIPMLFDVTNNRPTGQRGWFAYARVGADVVDPTAFQLLQNKTS